MRNTAVISFGPFWLPVTARSQSLLAVSPPDFCHLWGTAINCSWTWLPLSGLIAHVAKCYLPWPGLLFFVLCHLISAGKLKQFILLDIAQGQNYVLCSNSLPWWKKCWSGLHSFGWINPLHLICFAFTPLATCGLLFFFALKFWFEVCGGIGQSQVSHLFPIVVGSDFSWSPWERTALKTVTFFSFYPPLPLGPAFRLQKNLNKRMLCKTSIKTTMYMYFKNSDVALWYRFMAVNNSVRVVVKINLPWVFLGIAMVTSWSQNHTILKKYNAGEYMWCWAPLLAMVW